MKCDAIFEGGGVKGVAAIGAIQETEARGYSFNQIAGTSAGSIVGSLLAAGYTGKELEEIFLDLDFRMFLELTAVGKIPLIGLVLNILRKNGIYALNDFDQWMNKLLNEKGVHTFSDLPEGKLKIVASDLSNGRIMLLPDDLPRYGIEPGDFPISRAVRMSSSIPFFFQPNIIKQKSSNAYIVDGVILSNYPIWIFDSVTSPRWPTFGYRLRGADEEKPIKIRGPISLLLAIFSTMMEAHDRRYINQRDAARSIFIPVSDVKATDFRISYEDKKKLIALGREETSAFFDQWDFTAYIENYRFKNKENRSS
ncbi:patatin-like phospholipase family protein [Caldalkalibacillus salinus]|uniref:patatin-like phospholipase family protein n=1 Tax=Caldalkalibacillus salinus TaxID=2803787 RepID=UPI0019222EE9